MKLHKLLLWILALSIFLFIGAGYAESAADDLSGRFSSETQLEYQGASYALKNRITTLFFSAYEHKDEENQLLLALILLVDDDLDRIVPIQMDGKTLLSAGEYAGLTLENLLNLPATEVAASTPEDAMALRLLDGTNSLFLHPLAENYMALDIQGLDLLDGGPVPYENADAQSALKARLKAILAEAEQKSSSAQMEMFDSLSAYLATDVKTGALMKIAKKAERYEVLPTQFLPGTMETTAEGPNHYLINQEELIPFLIEYFYEEPLW